jgi:hypothetical protein
VPLVWCGIEHPRAAVASEEYQGGLEKAATRVPVACNVVLLADRGFAETELMHHLQRLGGHLRLRITSTFWISRPGDGGVQVRARSLVPGHTRFWHGVLLTTKRFGLVHLAVARPLGSAEYWYGISDEPTEGSGQIRAKIYAKLEPVPVQSGTRKLREVFHTVLRAPVGVTDPARVQSILPIEDHVVPADRTDVRQQGGIHPLFHRVPMA